MWPSHALLDQVSFPVIAAPMFLVSGEELVIAACRAGIIGAFPASNARTAEELAGWLDRIGAALGPGTPYAVNIVLKPGRYADPDALVDVCREARVPIVITSVGDPTAIAAKVHGWGGLALHDVTTVRHARKAAEAGVDGLILVCAGAGGHAGRLSPFSFLRQVRSFFDELIVLAGGLADGHGVRAARALGADLVYMGTRFIASAEALAPPAYKRMLIDSTGDDVVYTDAISGLSANFLRPSLIASGLDPDNLPPRAGPFQPRLPEGLKAWRDIWSAGHGVSLISDAPPVAEIVARLRAEYEAGPSLALETLMGSRSPA